MRFFIGLLGVLLSSAASAQEVNDCHQLSGRAMVIAPQDVSNRTYANGAVTLAVVHDGRKGATDSLFVAVYAPDGANPGETKCRLIGIETGRGYANVSLRAAVADYTSADGLTIEVPARIYVKESGFSNSTMLKVNVNQKSDEILVTQQLGTE